MIKWLVVLVVLVLLAFPLIGVLSGHTKSSSTGPTTALHENAQNGNMATVKQMLADGADPNARDESGRTPLHLAANRGHNGTSEVLLKGGADPNALDVFGKTALSYAQEHGHTATIDLLTPVTTAMPTSVPGEPAGTAINPNLKYRDEATFSAAIGEPGILLKSDHVWLFAPKRLDDNAAVVFPYLTKAYDELYALTGMHTEYTIVVYNFPKGHSEAFGGTSNCTIYYDENNLHLDQSEEWTAYHVPHVSGYIEEMAHNFSGGAKVQFGWEMVGWSLGVVATERVAPNPVLARFLESTRRVQDETFQRYVALGYRFPDDIAPNLVDRIHAHVLHECEQAYGPRFWPDFFAEIRNEQPALRDAGRSGGDTARNLRYQIAVECFDRLPGLNFRQRLRESGISLTTDIKALHPTEPGWDRRLTAPDEV